MEKILLELLFELIARISERFHNLTPTKCCSLATRFEGDKSNILRLRSLLNAILWFSMIFGRRRGAYLCLLCLRRQLHSYRGAARYGRSYTTSGALPQQERSSEKDIARQGQMINVRHHDGQMSKRLAQMTEEFIEQGGRTAQKVVHDAGFSEALKNQLEERIRDSTFKSENSTAYSQVGMPV